MLPNKNNDNVEYNPNLTFKDIEKEYLYKAMIYHNNRKLACAKALGISKHTLYEKLKKYGFYKEFEMRKDDIWLKSRKGTY